MQKKKKKEGKKSNFLLLLLICVITYQIFWGVLNHLRVENSKQYSGVESFKRNINPTLV